MCSIMTYSQALELHMFAKAYAAPANDINIINNIIFFFLMFFFIFIIKLGSHFVKRSYWIKIHGQKPQLETQ